MRSSISLLPGPFLGEVCPDEDEFIHSGKYKLDEVINMIQDGTIKDAKTVAGILFVARMLETGDLKL